MAKVLRIAYPEKCIGCELCVMEVQRQLNKIGLEGSLIRVFKNKENQSMLGKLTFEINLDGEINNLNLSKIIKSCPTGVFKIEDVERGEEQLLE